MPHLFGRKLAAGRGLEVRAQEVNAGPVELLVYDVIGQYYDWATGEMRGIDGNELARTIRELEGRDLNVRINSPGGDVYEGVLVYNTLRSHAAKVSVAIDSNASSIASVIAMAADPGQLSMAESATMMIHAASGGVYGNAAMMRRFAEALDRIDASILVTYARRTGQTSEQLRSWMDEETYMNGADALERGFVDQLTDGLDIVAIDELSPQARSAIRQKELERLQVSGAAEALLEEKEKAEALAEQRAAEEAAALGSSVQAKRARQLRILRAEASA